MRIGRTASVLTVAAILSVFSGQLAVCAANSCCESHGTSEGAGGQETHGQMESDATTYGNTEMASAIVKALESGDPAAFEKLVDGDSYVSHSLHFVRRRADTSGAASAGALPDAVVDVRRILHDGDHIVAHSEYVRSGQRQVGLDVFGLEDGLIVEHWGNLQDLEEANPSGRTMLDGPVEGSDLEKTEENKALVERFVREILIRGRLDAVAGYFDGDAYVQHSPNVGDGVSSFVEALDGGAILARLEKLHFVRGQGDFVLAVSEGKLDGARVSSYDLFRVEDGFIAEHWDVIQAIPPVAD